jgi:hypothetical protein
MHTYVAVYAGRQETILASSLYAAKQLALKKFNPPKRRQGEVGIYLAALADGTEVQIVPQTY